MCISDLLKSNTFTYIVVVDLFIGVKIIIWAKKITTLYISIGVL